MSVLGEVMTIRWFSIESLTQPTFTVCVGLGFCFVHPPMWCNWWSIFKLWPNNLLPEVPLLRNKDNTLLFRELRYPRKGLRNQTTESVKFNILTYSCYFSLMIQYLEVLEKLRRWVLPTNPRGLMCWIVGHWEFESPMLVKQLSLPCRKKLPF